MDEQRFDAALKALHTGTTRRRGIAAALTVLLGGAGITANAAAKGTGKGKGKQRPGPEGPCGDGSAKDNRCSRASDCCTKYCAEGQCRCKPNWMACSKNDHCCSGRCAGGVCDGGCKPEGSRCEEQFNCCSGMICTNGVCTVSSKAKCGKNTCPGCCEGTTCRVGTTTMACGAAASACMRCSNGQPCSAGTCTPPPPSGCTSDSQCSGATPQCCGGQCVVEHFAVVATMGTTSTSGSGASQFSTPRQAAVSTDGLTVLVADKDNNRVSVWTRPSAASTNWTNQTTFGSGPGTGDSQFDLPVGVALSTDGLTAAVADMNNNRIVVWTRSTGTATDWQYQTKFGSAGASTSEFQSPFGISLSTDGRVLAIMDNTNNRIVVWSRSTGTATDWQYQSKIDGGGCTCTAGAFGDLCYAYSLSMTGDGLTILAANVCGSVGVWNRGAVTDTTWSLQGGFSGFTTAGDIGDYSAATSDGLTMWTGTGSSSNPARWGRPTTSSTTWTNIATATQSAPVINEPWPAISADGSTVIVTREVHDVLVFGRACP